MKNCVLSLLSILAVVKTANAGRKVTGSEFGPGAAPFDGAAPADSSFDSDDETCVPIDRDDSECWWQRQGSLRSAPRGVRLKCKLDDLAPNHAYTVWTHFLDASGERVGPPGRGAFGCSDEDGEATFKTDGWLTTTLPGDPWTAEQWANTDADAVLIDHGPCDDSIDQFSSPTVGCDPSFLRQCQEDETNSNGVPYCYIVGATVFEGV